MENQLIQIYLFVCQTYDTCSQSCFQRLSNNANLDFTEQELITIWFFALPTTWSVVQAMRFERRRRLLSRICQHFKGDCEQSAKARSIASRARHKHLNRPEPFTD